ncbi:MAG TPA: hypothetical protein VIG72_08695 [Pontibacter sp.]
MALNKKIEYYLQKTFAPDARLDERLLGKDITFFTNENGEAVTLFIGTRRPDGAIAGERYVRTIVRRPGSQEILKSHWDLKGKVERA